jgi:hypothetical protein
MIMIQSLCPFSIQHFSACSLAIVYMRLEVIDLGFRS